MTGPRFNLKRDNVMTNRLDDLLVIKPTGPRTFCLRSILKSAAICCPELLTSLDKTFTDINQIISWCNCRTHASKGVLSFH